MPILLLGRHRCGLSNKARTNSRRQAVVLGTPPHRSFLGLASYYRRFIAGHARITVPLTRLLKKDVPFTWGADEQRAFERLKRALVTAPVLQSPDPDLPYVVTTDASDYAVGAVLSQDDGAGDRPVAFTSSTL